MQPARWKSYTLVAIQFACLAAIALSGPLLTTQPLLLGMEAAAAALGVWALLTVRIKHVRVAPDPNAAAPLVRHGPYRWIRHPMYAALLLCSLALVLIAPTPLRWALWLILLANLLVKLHYEEGLLRQHYPEYEAYSAVSKRLIPYVY